MEYVAIIGDIKNSKKIEKRNLVQRKLNKVLGEVNDLYTSDISAKFIITLGDEFQGLLNRAEYVLEIIKYIQKKMYPVKIRFGVGIGEINTDIYHEVAIGSDGPAYYAARYVLEKIKSQEKKLKKQAADVQVSLYNNESLEIKEINMILSLMKVIEDSWSEQQRYTIFDMEQNGGSQAECAKRIGTTQSTVARRLADGCFITYEHAKNIVSEALKHIGEDEYGN